MSLTNSQLQARIEGIETWINTLQTAINNVPTRRELKNLVALLTQEVTSLRDQVGNVDATGVLYYPRYTTAERDALSTVSTGGTIYNTSLDKLQVYTGSSWETITSA